ncbi:MAG: winged helix-turn-helix transcriptional regulator [Phycisphaerae bacterium]|nr:winged helix-turn-helix transcriptional regulator [Gemmatimonadaceae bacterium]
MWLNIAPAPDNLDNTLAALADPTRRAILAKLALGETRVTDLAVPFAISLNAVSKHILTLERAALIRRRRAGREHWLSINTAPVDEAMRWLAAERAQWAARLQKLDDILVAQDVKAKTSPSLAEP